MSELAVSADDVAKFVRLQKAMYDSGASPQVCENCLVLPMVHGEANMSMFMLKIMSFLFTKINLHGNLSLFPQDIALVLRPLLEGAPEEKLEAIAQMLRERLHGEAIGAADVANALDFVDAFQNASIPPELVGSMALVQKVRL